MSIKQAVTHCMPRSTMVVLFTGGLYILSCSAWANDLPPVSEFAGDVTVNEIQTDGNNSVEYIELYFNQQANITGWTLFSNGPGASATGGCTLDGAYSQGTFLVIDDNCLDWHPNQREVYLHDANGDLVHFVSLWHPGNQKNQGVQGVYGNPDDWPDEYNDLTTNLNDLDPDLDNYCASIDGQTREVLWNPEGESCESTRGESNQGADDEDNFDFINLTFDAAAALTCEPLNISAQACNDANGGCSTFGGEVTFNFEVQSGQASFNPGSVNTQTGSAASGLAAGEAGEVVIAAQSTPEATEEPALYCNGEPADNNNCTIEFADARFIFENANGDTDLDAVTRYAGKPSNVQLRAVRKDDATQTCVAALAGEQSVDLGFECINPDTCHGSNPDFLINDSAITANDAGSGLSYSTQTLTFNNNGVAALEANYFDAGQIKLHAKADIEVEQETVTIQGASERFTVVPAGLCVGMNGSESGFDCSSNPDETCSVFKAAGEAFTLNISARTWQEDFGENWDNSAAFCDTEITPNFAMDGIGLSSSVIAPEDGVDGTLTPSSFDIAVGDDPTLVSTAQMEVGVFDLIATPKDYFGHAMRGGVLAQVGRFTPAYFTLANPQVNPGCAGSGFTYMDQPFSLAFNLIPRAKQFDEGEEVFPGPETQNYTGAFVRFDENNWYRQHNSSDSIVGVLEPSEQADALEARLQTEPLDMTLPEADNFTGTPFVYPQWLNRLAPQDDAGVADGPFQMVYALSNLADTDGVFLEVRENGAVVREEIAINTTPALMRHGRLALDQAHYYRTIGTDAELTIDATAEYFDSAAGRWQHSADDGCSNLEGVDIRLRNNFADSVEQGDQPDEIVINEDGDQTERNPVGNWDNGRQPITFSAPGGEVGGFVDVMPQLDNKYWLQFAWDGSGEHDQNPRGRVSWGIYRGEDNVIHIQEIWN